MSKEKTKIISLGGSLIHPENIDESYLKSFKKFIETRVKKGEMFIIICGGGNIARRSQKSLKNISNPPKEYLDWVGIQSTRLNAEIIRGLFYKDSYEKIVTDPLKFPKTNKKIIIASGWKPGWSTDHVSVVIAKEKNVQTVYNLSNIDYVYSDDPRKNKNAQRFDSIDWKSFLHIVGEEWIPGKNCPFDPVASKFSYKHKIKVLFLQGNDFENMKNCLDDKKFNGTIIY